MPSAILGQALYRHVVACTQPSMGPSHRPDKLESGVQLICPPLLSHTTVPPSEPSDHDSSEKCGDVVRPRRDNHA
jgi:hypothetical protein